MDVEEFIIPSDINTVCVIASSFPEGVLTAHQKLHSLIPFHTDRNYFGISWGDKNNTIHYQAAAEIMNPGEAEIEGTSLFTIKPGKYISIIVRDYMSNTQVVGHAFEKMLPLPNIDPGGYCLEWYISKQEVRCMVPLKNTDKID